MNLYTYSAKIDEEKLVQTGSTMTGKVTRSTGTSNLAQKVSTPRKRQLTPLTKFSTTNLVTPDTTPNDLDSTADIDALQEATRKELKSPPPPKMLLSKLNSKSKSKSKSSSSNENVTFHLHVHGHDVLDTPMSNINRSNGNGSNNINNGNDNNVTPPTISGIQSELINPNIINENTASNISGIQSESINPNIISENTAAEGAIDGRIKAEAVIFDGDNYLITEYNTRNESDDNSYDSSVEILDSFPSKKNSKIDAVADSDDPPADGSHCDDDDAVIQDLQLPTDSLLSDVEVSNSYINEDVAAGDAIEPETPIPLNINNNDTNSPNYMEVLGFMQGNGSSGSASSVETLEASLEIVGSFNGRSYTRREMIENGCRNFVCIYIVNMFKS